MTNVLLWPVEKGGEDACSGQAAASTVCVAAFPALCASLFSALE